MKKFLNKIWNSGVSAMKQQLKQLLGLSMVISSIILVIAIISMVVSLFSSSSTIEPNSIVKIKFDYTINDRPNTDPFTNFKLGSIEPNNSKNLYQVIKSINNAKNNPNVNGIILDLSNFQSPGITSTKEIRDALNIFKNSGKFIYTYSTLLTQTAYYLASVSDSIFLYPMGGIDFSGLSSTSPFFTETLSEIGIQPEVIRHGKFKAAVEPFLLTRMSKENKEQTSLLLNDIWGSMLQDISTSRGITIEKLNKLADDPIVSMIATKSVEKGLIDDLLHQDEFDDFIARKLNAAVEDLSFINLHQIEDTQELSNNKIAIVYAEGEINGSEDGISEEYATILKDIYEDDDISAIILRVNSPGGSALISDIILSQIKSLKEKKPLIVSMGNYAASGGYYISCVSDKIFASPTTITGSIGVFGLFFTGEELLKNKMRLSFDNVKTNKFADFGDSFILPIENLSDDEKSMIQIGIEKVYSDFINHVSEGRKMSLNRVDSIGQGRVWSGTQARKLGLVDEIGGLQDAVLYASQYTDSMDFSVVEFPKSKDGLELIFDITTQLKSFIGHKNIEPNISNIIQKELIHMQGIQARMPIGFKINE